MNRLWSSIRSIPKPRRLCADVPVMIGYNRTETTLFLAGDRQAFALDEEGLRRRVKLILRDHSERVIEDFPRRESRRDPIGAVLPDRQRYPMGAFSRKIAQRKSEQGRAPALSLPRSIGRRQLQAAG